MYNFFVNILWTWNHGPRMMVVVTGDEFTGVTRYELYDSGLTEQGRFNEVDIDLNHYDIALMKLKEPLEFNENVYPACLPSLDTSDPSLDGKIGFASGWGQSYWGGGRKS